MTTTIVEKDGLKITLTASTENDQTAVNTKIEVLDPTIDELDMISGSPEVVSIATPKRRP